MKPVAFLLFSSKIIPLIEISGPFNHFLRHSMAPIQCRLQQRLPAATASPARQLLPASAGLHVPALAMGHAALQFHRPLVLVHAPPASAVGHAAWRLAPRRQLLAPPHRHAQAPLAAHHASALAMHHAALRSQVVHQRRRARRRARRRRRLEAQRARRRRPVRAASRCRRRRTDQPPLRRVPRDLRARYRRAPAWRRRRPVSVGHASSPPSSSRRSLAPSPRSCPTDRAWHHTQQARLS
jgi:hypothetical protein